MSRNGHRLVAVVMAGHSPREADALAEATNGGPKALIPVGRKPMVQWVIEALCGSHYLERVVVMGLEHPLDLPCGLPIEYLQAPSAGMIDSACTGMRHVLDRWPETEAVLFSASDIPMVTTAAVDDFIAQCLETDHDFYYSMIARTDMERRFPASRRTYARLREGSFCGGDMILARPSMLDGNLDLLSIASGQRKSVWKQIRMMGVSNLALFAAGQLSIRRAEATASKLLGVRGRVIVSRYAELGMDIDKPHQLALAREELERE